MTFDPRELKRDLESLGRLITPNPRVLAREVMSRGRRTSRSRPFLPRPQQLRRLSPVLAVAAAVLLLGGPLAINLAGAGQRGRDAAIHQLLGPVREPDSDSRQNDVRGFTDDVIHPAVQPAGFKEPIAGPHVSGGVGGGSHPSPHPTAGGSPTPGGNPGPSPTPNYAGWCEVTDVSVSLATDHTTYDGGNNVRVWLRVVNHASYSCDVYVDTCDAFFEVQDAGGHPVYFSRSDHSTPCLPEGQNPLAPSSRLGPGGSAQFQLLWSRGVCSGASAGSQCTGATPAPAGYYTLIGHWYCAGAQSQADALSPGVTIRLR